jgi:hypothetical protein
MIIDGLVFSRPSSEGAPSRDLQDLLIPQGKSPGKIGRSPIFGFPATNRTTLLFFRGDFRNDNEPGYSRGIRQNLRSAAKKFNWKENHAVLIGSRNELPGPYADYLTTSRFCLVAPGKNTHAFLATYQPWGT